MNDQIFKKMKAKSGMRARVSGAPPEYPSCPELEWVSSGSIDFLHLFIFSQKQFEEEFPQAVAGIAEAALVWLSYPKSSAKRQFDINRDSLWDLLISRGWHPVAQVSLNELWSAVRVKPNEAGREYVRPGKLRTKGKEHG